MKKITKYKTRFLASHLESQDWRSSIALRNYWKVLQSWLANCGPCLLPQRTPQVSHPMSEFSLLRVKLWCINAKALRKVPPSPCFLLYLQLRRVLHTYKGREMSSKSWRGRRRGISNWRKRHWTLWKESSPRLNVDISLNCVDSC